MPAPIQQIWMMLQTLATPNSLKFWYNGMPIPVLQPTGSLKFWYNGMPVRSLKNS